MMKNSAGETKPVEITVYDLADELKALMAVVSMNTRISVFDRNGAKIQLKYNTIGRLRHQVKNRQLERKYIGSIFLAVPIDLAIWKLTAVCRQHLVLVNDDHNNVSTCGCFLNLKFTLRK